MICTPTHLPSGESSLKNRIPLSIQPAEKDQTGVFMLRLTYWIKDQQNKQIAPL